MPRHEKIYTVLCTLFTVLTVLGNVTYRKIVTLSLGNLHTFELSVGAILYPLTFLIMDLLTEFFGKKRATFCLKLSIAMDIGVAGAIAAMDTLQATSWSPLGNAIFHEVFGFYAIAFLGSILALYVAQQLDIALYLSIRRVTKGRFLWLRSFGSTSIALFIDTCIVVTVLTSFNVLPLQEWHTLILNSYMFKGLCAIISIPLFYGGIAFLSHLKKEC